MLGWCRAGSPDLDGGHKQMKKFQSRGTWLGHVSKAIACPAMCLIATWSAAATPADGAPQAGGSRPQGSPPPFLPDIKTPAPAIVKEPIDAARVAAMTATPQASAPRARPGVDPQANPRPAFQITDVMFQHGPDGTLWARGSNYKASFSAEGFTYIPYLGSQAPRNFPINFAIESVKAGNNAIAFTNAQPQVNGTRVSLDHGTFIESYDLRLDSVEQLFTFANKPANGEVKIRLSVESDWAVADAGDHLLFSNDLGSVSYSKAVVVDARAKRTDVPTQVVNGSAIDITLPASLLASAAYPLTVDPVLQTTNVSSGFEDHLPDVSYDASNDGYIAVWEYNFSNTDGDIYAHRLQFDGTLIGGEFSVDSTGDNWRNPRVANNNFVNNYLVVAQRGAAGSRAIWGATVSADTGAVGGQFQISNAADSGDKFNPDVGGDTYDNDPAVWYLVVWEREFAAGFDNDVHGQLVTPAGATSGGTILIDNSGGTLHGRPSVASNNGESEWLVAWQHDNGADDDILGSLINYDGAINQPTFSVDTSSSDNQNPSVSSRTNDSSFMVVYEENPTTEGDIWARVMNGTTILDGANLTIMEGVFTNLARRRPNVESNGVEFVVTQEQFWGAPFTDYDAYISSYCWDGSEFTLAEPHRFLSGGFEDDAEIRIASHGANGGGFIEEFLAVWCDRDLVTGFGDIQNGFYETGTCCPSDIDNDGDTDVDDLVAVILSWGTCDTCAADVNGDFSVNVDDLVGVILGWGPCT
jgi:hypothetical protein